MESLERSKVSRHNAIKIRKFIIGAQILIALLVTAIQDSLSDDVLLPLKSYKYSSVDKSFISRYILKHYVRHLDTVALYPPISDSQSVETVECVRGSFTAMVGS